MKTIIAFVIVLIISIGCYDPKLLMEIYNNSNQDIKIYDITIHKHSYKKFGFQDKFLIRYKIKNAKECFQYLIDSDTFFDENLRKLYRKYHFPNLKLQINNDKKLYLVFPNIKKFPVDQKELDKMQINGFPISPIRVECNKKIK